MNTVHSSFEPRWSNLPTLTRKIEVNSGDPHTPELVCVLITSKYENFIDNMKVIGKLCDRLQPSNLNDKCQDTSIVGLELLMCSKSLINSYQKTSSICLDKIEQETQNGPCFAILVEKANGIETVKDVISKLFTGSELSGSVYVSESVDSAMLQAPMFFTQVHGNIKYQADSMKLLIKGETIVDKRLESIPLVSPYRAWNGKNTSVKAASAVSCQNIKPVVLIAKKNAKVIEPKLTRLTIKPVVIYVNRSSATIAAKVEDGWKVVSKNKRSKK